MFQYEYVSIDNEKFLGVKLTKHQEIIDDYAKKGYRYVGYIPTKMSDYGKPLIIDLIFEMQGSTS